MKDFINHILIIDNKLRPDVNEILNHPYISLNVIKSSNLLLDLFLCQCNSEYDIKDDKIDTNQIKKSNVKSKEKRQKINNIKLNRATTN